METVTLLITQEKVPVALPKHKPLITTDAYFKYERAAEDRHIYLDGEIYAMAGESAFHADISANIMISLGSQLKGKRCRARTKDTKVRSGPGLSERPQTRGMFSYPDIVVICGEPEYHDEHKDIVTNPTAIIEVLSPATEGFDRGAKFTNYQIWNPTLKDYLLVSQDKPQFEHFSRQADGTWSYQLHTGLDAAVSINSIQCKLTAVDVYDRIEFETP